MNNNRWIIAVVIVLFLAIWISWTASASINCNGGDLVWRAFPPGFVCIRP